jgi:hypothetical protein
MPAVPYGINLRDHQAIAIALWLLLLAGSLGKRYVLQSERLWLVPRLWGALNLSPSNSKLHTEVDHTEYCSLQLPMYNEFLQVIFATVQEGRFPGV